jgi:hypothetical protein
MRMRSSRPSRHQLLTPVILATQKTEIRNCGSKPARANSSGDSILKKKITKKKGLDAWLKS